MKLSKSDEKKIDILFIIPSLEGGGAERVLLNILLAFDYNKYNVDLYLGNNSGVYNQDIPAEINVNIVFPNPLIEKFSIILHRRFNISLLAKFFMNRNITGPYDIGISFIDSYYTDFLIFLGDKVKRKITWIHASYKSYINYYRYYKGGYKKRLTKSRYGKLDKIVFVSNDSRNEFTEIFGAVKKSEVIYNFLDIENIRRKSLQPMEAINGDKIVKIVASGSLIPVKAYDKLIIAAKKLHDDGYKFKIVILGDGCLKKKLLKLISVEGLTDCIELAGFKTNPYPIMKAADIFVMTSKSEALPTALCEAMVLGLPCLVTDCSGCREISGNGEYAIMTGQSALEICDGLKALISDKGLRHKYREKSLQRSIIFNDNDTLRKIYSLLSLNVCQD